MFPQKCFQKMLGSFGRSLKAWSACVFLVGLPCGHARAADAVVGVAAARSIPIMDSHFHVMAWMNVRELVEYMDRNGVRWAGGAGIGGVKSPGEGLPKFLETVSILGSRYIRPTGQGQWLSLHRKLDAAAFENPDTPEVDKTLSAIEADLRDRGAHVISEIHVNARTTSPEPFTRFKERADSRTLKALFDLAGKYDRPLNIHVEWDPDTAQEVERLAASNRRARLILSHCGCFATASDIRGVFERNANISCDLSNRGTSQVGARSAYQAVFDEDSILGGWKQLIEDYPERFVVGVDVPQSWEQYERTLRLIRFGLLANLSPETAEKVAYKNAQTWFGLK